MPLERIDYADGETALTGWLARPSGTARAAVAVFPTFMNATPGITAKAEAPRGSRMLGACGRLLRSLYAA